MPFPILEHGDQRGDGISSGWAEPAQGLGGPLPDLVIRVFERDDEGRDGLLGRRADAGQSHCGEHADPPFLILERGDKGGDCVLRRRANHAQGQRRESPDRGVRVFEGSDEAGTVSLASAPIGPRAMAASFRTSSLVSLRAAMRVDGLLCRADEGHRALADLWRTCSIRVPR